MKTKLPYPLFLFLIPLLLFGSCSRKRNWIIALRQSVTDHYASSDSTRLQLEAAVFLFDNLPFHPSAIHEGAGEILSCDFFIRHIDHCFRMWRDSELAKNLSFEQFKEYILPFEVCDGATTLKSADERWLWVKDHIIHPDSVKSPEHFIGIYNDLMSKSRTDDIDCTIKASLCVLCMRAIGIPSVAERNIAYRRLTAFHVHCAYYDTKSAKFFRFNAEEPDSKPDSSGWNWTEMQNIYRIRFSPDIDSPFFLRQLSESPIPPFDNPCLTDVSRNGSSASLKIKSDSLHNIVYLAVFNPEAPGGMRPVAWGLADSCRSKADFRNLLTNTLYYPGVSDNGHFRAIDHPFILSESSEGLTPVKPKFLHSENNETETIFLSRKFPVKDSDIVTAEALVGSRIEASENPDFSNAVTLLSIDIPLRPAPERYNIQNNKSYKYYRFVPPRNHQKCDISILKWFDETSEIIPPENCDAYDGDMTTAPSDSITINLLLDHPIRLTSVELAPKNSDNGVSTGHQYILRRFDMESLKWIETGKTTAYSDSICFENIPKGALLWLSDITKGREETPFIYSDNKQKFLYYDLIPE